MIGWLLTHGPARRAQGLILTAAAILLFLLIVGIGLINFLISRRISTGDAPRNRVARRRARSTTKEEAR